MQETQSNNGNKLEQQYEYIRRFFGAEIVKYTVDGKGYFELRVKDGTTLKNGELFMQFDEKDIGTAFFMFGVESERQYKRQLRQRSKAGK